MEHKEDISTDVTPHAHAIFRFGILFIPLRGLLRLFRLTSAEKLGRAVATYHQYTTLKKGCWTYGIYCLRKLPA